MSDQYPPQDPNQPQSGQPYPGQPYPPQGGYPNQGYQQTGNPKADAKAAKAYAKASRPWFKKKRFVLPLAFVVIIVIASVAGGGGETDNTASDTGASDTSQAPAESNGDSEEAEAPASEAEAPASSAAPKPKAPKPVAVEASAIIKEFDDNELAADSKYKGKDLRITGVVASIDTDFLDDSKYILGLNGGGDLEFLTLNCNDMDNEELATLSTGDDVTVVGEFDDGGDLGVEVKNCSLA